MFWRFGFNSASALEALIEKEGVKLDDVMTQEDLLQEIKGQNPKIVEYLCKPHNLKTLLDYVVAKKVEDEQLKFKFPFVASEIIGCECMPILEAILANKEILEGFWTFLDAPSPLNILNASYFSKMNSVLMLSFLRENPKTSERLLNHLDCHAVTDFILKLIAVEDSVEGQGTLKWLRDQGLISKLFSLLDPKYDPDVHSTASQTLIDIINATYQTPVYDPQNPQEPPKATAVTGNHLLVTEMKTAKVLKPLFANMMDRSHPNTSSSLISGITVVMEIIRRYCSEIETVEMQHHDYNVQLQNNQVSGPFHGMEKVISLSSDLNDLFSVFCQNLSLFANALDNPITPLEPVETTMGKQIPVGTERLKICELFAEFIHLQYLFTSSPLFDFMVTPAEDKGDKSIATVADGLMLISESFIQEKIMERCINMFFVFPWNNFIHSVVYDMIAKVFNTYSFTANLPSGQQSNEIPKTSQYNVSEAHKKVEIDPQAFAQNKMRTVRRTVKKLVVTIFKSANLISQIINAQRQNDYNEEQPKGVRLGYMGHLTYISDEVCKLFEKCGTELDDELHECIVGEDWNEYVTHSLRHTQETDRQPLGGSKPDQAGNMIRMGGGAIDGEFSKPKVSTDTKKDPADVDEEALDTSVNADSAYNDQFARFLCQQIVKDLPDRFLGDNSSDEDEDKWIGDVDENVVEFDIGEAISHDNLYNHPYQRDGDEETVSDDLESVQQELELRDTLMQPEAKEFSMKSLEESLPDSLRSTEGASNSSWADFSKLGSQSEPSTKAD